MSGEAIYILGIETSNPSVGACEVGLARIDAGVCSVEGVEALAPTTRHDDDLMPAIERLCRRCGVRPMEIGRVAVSVGPGGYTTVRVAVAAAKMIAEAARAGCVGVPTAQAAAHVAMNDLGVERAAVFLAAKGDTAYGACFERPLDVGPLTPIGSPGIVDGAGASTMLGASRRADGVVIVDPHISSTMREAIAQAMDDLSGVGVGAWRGPIRDVRFSVGAVLELGAVLPAADPVEVLPLYPREPDAVTLWRARHGAAQPPR